MNRELVGALAWGGGILVVAVAAATARKLGYVDGDTVTRIVIGLNGLMIAWYGNRMPKTVIPHASAGVQRARRLSAWSMVLSGLVYAGVWAFAPIPVALIAGCAAVFGGVAVTLGYCLSLRDAAKAA